MRTSTSWIARPDVVAMISASSSARHMVATPVDESLVSSFRESGAGVERVNGHMVLSVTDLQHLNALVDQLRSRGGVLSELTPVRSTLEDVFVDLIRTDAHTSVGAHE